jgi:hypothetical protein
VNGQIDAAGKKTVSAHCFNQAGIFQPRLLVVAMRAGAFPVDDEAVTDVDLF